MKLDIGCGLKKHKGYIGIDKRRLPTVDIVLDLDKQKLPFPDNSVEEVLLYHVLEHLESPYKVMKEVIRVCRKGAIIKVRVPYQYHPNAFLDPEHKYVITPEWFRLFPELEILEVKQHLPYGYPHKLLTFLLKAFRMRKISFFQPDEWIIILRKK